MLHYCNYFRECHQEVTERRRMGEQSNDGHLLCLFLLHSVLIPLSTQEPPRRVGLDPDPVVIIRVKGVSLASILIVPNLSDIDCDIRPS